MTPRAPRALRRALAPGLLLVGLLGLLGHGLGFDLRLGPRPAAASPAAAPPPPRPAAPAPGPAAASRAREPGQVVRVEHRAPDAVPTRGPADAPVTIELFFLPATNSQLRMPSYRAIERLQANHPQRIRVIYRIVKRNAPQLPTAALEAHAQGKFFELMEELQPAIPSTLSTVQLLEIAKKIGMDVPRLAAALKDGRYSEVLEANEQRLDRIMRTSASMPTVLFNTRQPRTALTTMTDADYEREYNDAYERAMELLDRGVERRSLMEAFDALVLRSTQPFVGSGPTDNDTSGETIEHRLASPPLAVTGLPSFGKSEAKGTIPVVLLCRPNAIECGNSIQQLRKLQKTYSDEVRLVWAPWFDVSRDDAPDLTLLGDAALCAEEVGSNAGDLNSSPGWVWVEKQTQRVSRVRGRRPPPEQLVDQIGADANVDPQPLAACRARRAGATVDWIERARRAGVTRAPALIIGGRIYEGIPDPGVIQQLIEAELAPGVLGELAPAWPRTR
jgi:predicted DsbA family dithiol-disulfide isomerase